VSWTQTAGFRHDGGVVVDAPGVVLQSAPRSGAAASSATFIHGRRRTDTRDLAAKPGPHLARQQRLIDARLGSVEELDGTPNRSSSRAAEIGWLRSLPTMHPG
jgi:hypothetical protein